MSTYQNSSGNSGISRQYGEWRYFNANLGKLDNYRAPRLNTKIQPVVAKQQVDWGKALVEVNKGLFGLFEARREYSYKLADDWLAKHSLEEYHQMMKEGNVPFQDDPLAMQRLKFRHGEILADIAQQDFQSRIDNGEFVGMEPEEVDAENFKYMNQVLNEDTDVYPYKADGDWFFNQGFWANSNKFRQQVFAKSKAVDDDRNKQQALIETEASVQKMAYGGANGKQLNDAITLAYDAYGYHLTPTEYSKLASGLGDVLSSTPWGSQILEQMKDTKVPSLGNITYGDIWGGEQGVQNLKIKSVNFRYSNDMGLRRSDVNNIEAMVDRGDVEGLQQKAMQIRAEDGGDSTRFKEYWDAVAKAQTQRDKQNKKAAKGYKEATENTANLLLADTYNSYLKNRDPRLIRDTNKEYWTALGKQLGHFDPDADVNIKLTRENIDAAFDYAVRSGRYSPNDIASMANATYDTYNPARTWINKNSSNAMRNIQGQINGLVSKPDMRIAEPENFATLMKIYNSDPSTFGNLDSKDSIMMQTMFHGLSSGVLNYDQMLRSMSWYAGESKDSKDVKVITNRVIKRDITDKLDLLTLGEGGAIDNTPMVKSLVQYTAGFYKVMGLTNEDAITKAVEQINDNFYQIGNNMVPKRFFNNNELTLKGTEALADKWAGNVEKELKARNMDFDGVNIWHNPYDNTIGVYDKGNGNEIMSLTQEGLKALIDKEKENIFIRVKAEDYRRAAGGTGVVPETFEGGD